MLNKFFKDLLRTVLLSCSSALFANQTATITPINPSQKDVPFTIAIKRSSLTLPNGLQSFIVGGIQSTVPDTEHITDSAASPYIFKVVCQRNR